jgi:hypothetical protein
MHTLFASNKNYLITARDACKGHNTNALAQTITGNRRQGSTL